MTENENICPPTALIKKKLALLLDEKGISHRAASLYIGKSESYINKFLKEDTPERLDEVDRMKLAALLKVDEQELTDIDLTKTRQTPPVNVEILGEILESIEEWLAQNQKRLNAAGRIKLSFSIYTKVFSLPKEERKAQVKFITDFIYDTLKAG